MSSKRKSAIGFDLGGSHVTAAGVHKGLLVTQEVKAFIDPNWTQEQILNQIAFVALSVKELLVAQGFEVVGFGGGIPGPADYDAGIIGETPNLPMLRGCHIHELLSERIGLPVKSDNDANLTVFGESVSGAGNGYEIVYGQTLGSGNGHGLVIKSQIYHGSNFMAMEMAKAPTTIDGDEATIESIVSTGGIERFYENFAGQKRNPKEIQELAEQGDQAAVQTYIHLGQWLGFSLSWAQGFLAPDIMLIGGNIAKAWDLFAPAMFMFLNKHSWVQNPVVKPMTLGQAAGIIGGASLFK